MNESNIAKLLLAKGHRKNLLVGAILRIGFVILLWLAVAIPRNPSWKISGDWWTHLIFLLVLAWALAVLAAYYFRRFVVLTTFISTFIVDIIAITVLVIFTGGTYSPFIIMYLIEIVGVFFLVNFWQGLVVSAAAIVFYVLMNVVTLVSGIFETTPFSTSVPTLENPVLWGTTVTLILVLIAYTIVLNAIMSRRLDRMRKEVVHYKSTLQESGDELLASFHDLESVADRYKEQQILSGAAQSQLLLSDKYASLGWLAAGVMLQFNNPMSSILTDIETLMMNPNETLSKNARETCQKVINNVERIKGLMNNLTQTVRPDGPNNFSLTNLNRLVERVVTLFKMDLKRRPIEFTTDFAAELTPINAIESQLEQAFIHLLTNSLDAIGGGRGKVKVATWADDANQFVEIQDNGRGIAPEDLSQIFLPRFTTHPDKQGAGLGLFVVKEILEIHNGQINVKSSQNKGTVLTLSFPLPTSNA